jgi:hypothetical protein
MIVQYHPLTASDLTSAVSYCNRQRPGLGDDFRSEIYATIDRMPSNPYQFPAVEHGIRRGFVRRYPIPKCFALLTSTRSECELFGTTVKE